MINFFSEIKNRTLLILLALVSSLIISYTYKNILIFLVIKPIIGIKTQKYFYFVFSTLTELFTSYLKLVYFVGLYSTGFYILYSIVSFLSPALYKTENNTIRYIGILSFIVWLLTNIFIYTILLPYSWNFFLSFQQNLDTNNLNIFFEANISGFVIFIVNICIINNFICQFFIFVFFFIDNKKNTINHVKNLRKSMYVLFFIAATLLSPPDITSQLLIGIILIILYEFLVYISIFKNSLRQPIKTNQNT